MRSTGAPIILPDFPAESYLEGYVAIMKSNIIYIVRMLYVLYLYRDK